MTDRQRIAALERQVERLEEASVVLWERSRRHSYGRAISPTHGPLAGIYRRVRKRKAG